MMLIYAYFLLTLDLLLKDDYINASYIRNLCVHSPDFIVSQLPVRGCTAELLSLVWQEGVETMVSLIPDGDTEEVRYIPSNKEGLSVGDYTVSVLSTKVRPLQKVIILTRLFSHNPYVHSWIVISKLSQTVAYIYNVFFIGLPPPPKKSLNS